MRLMTQWEREGWVKGKAEGRKEGRAEGRIKGRAEGILKGKAKGRVEGHARGRVEGLKAGEQAVVLRLVKRRFGRMPVAVRKRICELELERVEALAEALLDFKKWNDLIHWLRQSNRH